jgi:hypothetical protein
MHSPVAVSQTREVLSSLHVTARAPLAHTLTAFRRPSWPRSSARQSPLSASHTRAVVSCDAVITRWLDPRNCGRGAGGGGGGGAAAGNPCQE